MDAGGVLRHSYPAFLTDVIEGADRTLELILDEQRAVSLVLDTQVLLDVLHVLSPRLSVLHGHLRQLLHRIEFDAHARQCF